MYYKVLRDAFPDFAHSNGVSNLRQISAFNQVMRQLCTAHEKVYFLHTYMYYKHVCNIIYIYMYACMRYDDCMGIDALENDSKEIQQVPLDNAKKKIDDRFGTWIS